MVPQRLENRVPLIEVVMNGVSFLYESKFLFKPGIHHIVNLVVDKNPEQVKIEIGRRNHRLELTPFAMPLKRKKLNSILFNHKPDNDSVGRLSLQAAA